MTKPQRIAVVLFATIGLLPLTVWAQNEGVEAAEEIFRADAAESAEKSEKIDPELYERPTSMGVRFTPAIARAMTYRMTEQMKQRYELEDEQVEKIRTAVTQNLMELAHENEEMGQDLIESMMASMISNEGSFKKEDAVEFGKKMSPFIPKLREFFTDSAKDIGKVMTLKQRLRYTADMTALTAGLTVFEKRMNDWRDGKVKEGANPFFDAPGGGEDDDADENADPNETKEMRRARQGVERSIRWQINYTEDWERYVTNAAVYYDFDEEQQTAANGILDACKKKAERVQTDEWWARLKQNRIAARLNRSLDSKYSQGPVDFQLDQAFERMKQPLEDITIDLKKRIERLPTTRQRLQARRRVEELMQEKGLDALPL